MFKSSTLIASDTRIAAAATAGGVIIFLTVGLIVLLTPAAPATNVAAGTRSQPLAACSQRAWPNYEQNCLVDKRGSTDEARTVRIVSIDRL